MRSPLAHCLLVAMTYVTGPGTPRGVNLTLLLAVPDASVVPLARLLTPWNTLNGANASRPCATREICPGVSPFGFGVIESFFWQLPAGGGAIG